MPDLLIELLSEEIPARMQARACADLKTRITNGLVEAGLTYASAAAFSTPRRLALTVEGLLGQSPMQREERKGPRTDAPAKAVEGFLRATGLTREQLSERDDKKGAVFFALIEKPGRSAAEIVAQVLEDVIRNFPWPKSMRWGTGTLRWVRPLRGIVCILSDEAGSQVVPFEIEGFAASNRTEGHRFMAPAPFEVTGFDDYAAKLQRAYVVLDPAARAEAIWHDAANQAFAQGLELVEDKALLTEVAGLVEWPVVLMGRIDPAFMALPAEVLQTSMREHQKFFSVRDPNSGRIVRFVTVANRETADDGATILSGNQKVLFARLSDAKFFWENDLRIAVNDKMQPWRDSLANVTFHNKLGSQKDRIERIATLAETLAPFVGGSAEMAGQAARVAKADLSSEMVYEFPELQGLMGRYYSDAAGLDPAIGAACEEHYAPLGPSDSVPSAPISVAVALADKIDILTGFWAIDEKPTGSKDPFALRRAALGVIRLLLENGVRLSLLEIFKSNTGLRDIAGARMQTEQDLLGFVHERLKTFLRDQNIRHDIIDACLAMPGNDDLTLLVHRARALAGVLATDDGENLVQGFKRANNILRQAEEKDGVAYEFGPDRKYAEDPAEIALFDALDAAKAAISPAIEAEDFASAMAGMASLRSPIDGFFEKVQVNAENAIIRRNRLNLLHLIRVICTQVADLEKIEG
ncbi:MAG: glycyl-tRNA synthetase beta chain [Paracoccaceae bacterium]|jgi:glycyl-tRNA synthetase beta chain